MVRTRMMSDGPSNVNPGLWPLLRSIDELREDPKNARLHPDRNIDEIMRSLADHGQQTPVNVDATGMVLKGNGTLRAARALGWTQIAAVEYRSAREKLTKAEQRRYALRDNRTGESSVWDRVALAEDLVLQLDDGFSLDEIGFEGFSLDGGDKGTSPDPEVAGEDEPCDSRVGEIYQLGPHRLLCGDSTSADNVARLLDGAQPRLWFVDPPYDLDYRAWPLMPSIDVAVVWHRSKNALLWMAETFREEQWGVHALVFTGGVRGQWSPSLPCCMHDNLSVWRRKWWGKEGDAIDAAVVRATGARVTKDGRHMSWQEHVGGVLTGQSIGMSWGKPVLESEIAVSYVPRGSVVWDPCAGAGSSLLATATHGRVWIGAEMQPRWADLLRRRWTRWAIENRVDPGPGALGENAPKKKVKPRKLAQKI
jgi:hypothetical protein